MQSNYNSSVGSNPLQLTPLHSQNQSQTQKSFNFHQAQNTSFNAIGGAKPAHPGQHILASPMVSNDSNLPT